MEKTGLINKALYMFILFLLIISFFNDEYNNYKIQKEIEKEVEKIEPYQKPFTLKDVKNDFENIVNKYRYLLKKEKNIKDNCPIWMIGIKE